MADLEDIEARYASCGAMTSAEMDRLRRETPIVRFRRITADRLIAARARDQERLLTLEKRR